MLTRLSLSFMLLSLIACTPNIRDYDGGKLQADQIARIKKAQDNPTIVEYTPPHVELANDDNVFVTIDKQPSITGAQGIRLDVWKATAVNKNTDPQCVRIDWKLMDFNLETSLPYEFLMKAGETLTVGTMTQTIWSFDGTAMALPPSGYVDKMNARDAEFDEKKKLYTCDMVEADIQEPK
jgi:hypothetical protein